jgi:heme-degrading monooxygenase HmoA
MTPIEHDREYLALVSSIPPRSRASTWQLFRGAREVRRQLSRTDGVIGFSLLARPWRKQYATLSVWVDADALTAFVDAAPHRELMTSLASAMAPTKFVRWTIHGREGRPRWRDALIRLS